MLILSGTDYCTLCIVQDGLPSILGNASQTKLVFGVHLEVDLEFFLWAFKARAGLINQGRISAARLEWLRKRKRCGATYVKCIYKPPSYRCQEIPVSVSQKDRSA